MQKTEAQRVVDRLILCSEVISKTHQDFVVPESAEEKADILLSVDDLTRSIMRLRKAVLDEVWPGEVPEED
jgi:hypothetical protein